MRHAHHTPRPRGFTLVELLVVMTIIGILMAIMVPAVYYARIAAMNARITFELSQLSSGLEEYKNTFGDYPPNFNNPQILQNHLSKRQRLSRQQIDANASDNIPQFSELVMGGRHEIDPAEALVFWLGGQSPANPSASGGAFLGGGLRNNPVAPLQPQAGPGEAKMFFEFDTSRLTDRDNDGWLEYCPPGAMNAPYVYFESRSYIPYRTNGFALGNIGGADRGITVPSVNQLSASLQSHFVNSSKFQILTSGLDGMFDPTPLSGGGRLEAPFPSGPFAPADRDNISSFSEGRTFQDSIP